jgi:hypothetical protein
LEHLTGNKELVSRKRGDGSRPLIPSAALLATALENATLPQILVFDPT